FIYILCYGLTLLLFVILFFNAPPPTELYTLSLHDALPIYPGAQRRRPRVQPRHAGGAPRRQAGAAQSHRAEDPAGADGGLAGGRSEEHTSELQSRENLVCRLLLEKKKSIACW